MPEAVNLNRLAYFAAVVDTGSFTRAAERLGVTKTVVSQQVARLEAEVGTSLLIRTTRRVEPTEAGRTLHARCVMILREADIAFSELAQSNSIPSGTLRVTAPNDYGCNVVAPLVGRFTARYPTCAVDLIIADAKLDLVQEQIDLSIRVGWLDGSSLQARRIGAFRQVLVAAPALADKVTATDPDALPSWPFIANTALRDPLLWHFSRNDLERRAVPMRAAVSMNVTPAVLAATRAGGGMSILPDYLVADDLKAGSLVRLLPEWDLPAGGIYAVYPPARYRPAKVTAFVAMLIDAVKAT
ncbi:LysR family transcriptional regulator [Nitrospirillum pindoramense]|uniref:DNA-binding transcriptional LysR family regulator n=1 Tax=Nitrospirillum amazonense TaxID=28077 RepID=A0A560HBP3_9PROT|nr:LysR family transcriptional regulator [Nitrospirillum amazonense]TWB43783.1 DNA-binding transcriptional LysR family regulator [Nitrospirillum amazonense]